MSNTTKQHNDSTKIRIEPNINKTNGQSNKMITTNNKPNKTNNNSQHKPIASNTSSSSVFSPSKVQIPIAAKPPSLAIAPSKVQQHNSNGISPSSKTLNKTTSKQLNVQPQKQQQQQAHQIPIIINGNFQSILAACSNNNGAQQLATAAMKQQQQQQIQVNTQPNQNNQQNLNLNQLQQYFQMANGNTNLNGQNLLCAQQQLRPQGMIFQPNTQQQQQGNQTQASIPLLATTSSSTQQTTTNNKPNTTQPTKNNSKTKQTLPNQNIIPQTSTSQSAPTTMFTATQTADGQIIFQTIPATSAMNNLSSMSQSPLQTNTNNHDLNQMQQNQLLMNLFKGAQGSGNLQQQFILNAAQQSTQQQQHQQQLNQLIQQNMMQQQQQQQQIFLNQLPIQSGLFSQPVASSTPTPILPPPPQQQQQQNSDSNIQLQNQLRQKLLQEEQKNQQLQQQLEQKSNKIKQEKQSPNKSVNQSPNSRPTTTKTNETLDLSMNKDKTSVKSPSQNIKPKPLEMKSNKTDELILNHQDSSHKESSKLNKSSNSLNSKRRGRPRLYAVNPETGKAIKGCLINESGKSPKAIAPNTVLNQQNGIPVHLATQNGMAIFPLPFAATFISTFAPKKLAKVLRLEKFIF